MTNNLSRRGLLGLMAAAPVAAHAAMAHIERAIKDFWANFQKREIRLPVAIAADDEGPGASFATGAASGAPAPGDSMILKHARAC